MHTELLAELQELFSKSVINMNFKKILEIEFQIEMKLCVIIAILEDFLLFEE